MGAMVQGWFLAGIVGVFLVAALAPGIAARGGPLHLGPWQDALFVVMFLVTGLSLRTDELKRAAGHWRLHGLCQGISLVFCPLLAFAASPVMQWFAVADPWRLGVVVTLCLPMTISSCVQITRLAGGDEAAALTQATLGGILGVVVTPLWLLLILGNGGHIDAPRAIGHLLLIVVVPVVAGQVARRLVPRILSIRWLLTQLSTVCLLVSLHQAFCGSFVGGGVLGWPLAILAMAMGLLHLALLGGSWWASAWSWWGLDPGQRVAASFCASHKTAALGFPLIMVIFQGDPRAGAIALPLIAFHLSENLIDGVIALRVRSSVLATVAGRYPAAP